MNKTARVNSAYTVQINNKEQDMEEKFFSLVDVATGKLLEDSVVRMDPFSGSTGPYKATSVEQAIAAQNWLEDNGNVASESGFYPVEVTVKTTITYALVPAES